MIDGWYDFGDKPAATGSREPTCAKCNQPIRGHDLTGHRIELPTPPASQPTVTLDRAVELLEHGILAMTGRARVAWADKVREFLALLRAAEQK